MHATVVTRLDNVLWRTGNEPAFPCALTKKSANNSDNRGSAVIAVLSICASRTRIRRLACSTENPGRDGIHAFTPEARCGAARIRKETTFVWTYRQPLKVKR